MLAGLGFAVAFVFAGGLALWALSSLAEALRTGSARLRRRTYSERQMPIQFWLTVIGQLVILLGWLYVLVQLIARWST